MERAKELRTIKKSLKKNKQAHKKLEEQYKTLKDEIREEERAHAYQDRVRFLQNVQAHKLPNFLKRPLPVHPDDKACFILENLSLNNDYFPLITQYLGPMECCLFASTCRTVRLLVRDTFHLWASQFLDRLGEETVDVSQFKEHKTDLLSLIHLHNHPDPEATLYLFMPRLFALWHATFRKYRPFIKWREAYTTFKLHESVRTHIFLSDRKSRELIRADSQNLLVATEWLGRIADQRAKRNSEKYGDPLLKPFELDIDYFHYNDLNKLNFRPLPINEGISPCDVYRVQLEEAKITRISSVTSSMPT